MSKGRGLRAIVAAAAAGLALAACGGGSGGGAQPSALDPANMVPGGSVLYVSATIRPQGSAAANLSEAIDSVAGRGAAKRLAGRIEKSLGKRWGPFKSFAGQRVGFALTTLPAQPSDPQALADDALVVIPTNDPAAARKWLAANVKSAGTTWKVVGHYALAGGENAVGQALGTTAKTALAADPGYRSDLAQLGGGDVISAYAPVHQLLTALLPLLRADPQVSSSALAKAQRRIPAGSSVAFGLAAQHNQFRMDIVSHGMPQSSSPGNPAADVGSLPGSSWLALTILNGLTKQSSVNRLATMLPSLIARVQATSGAAGQVPSAPLRFLEHDLVPALGPMAMSVSGTSGSTLQAGLVISPLNPSAGPRLANAVKHLVNGLPLTASTVGGRVVVTFGYNSLQQFLDPSAKLADNPDFKSALAQLPSGARAGLYLNFGPVALLSALDHSANDASVLKVLHRLRYLIAGGTHTHFRLVLATK